MLSLSSDDSDEPPIPPRAPSRLDFCTQEMEDFDTPIETESEAVTRPEKVACKIHWPRSLFRGNRTRNKKHAEEDDDDTDVSYSDLSYLPTLRNDENFPEEDSDSGSQTFFPAPPPCQAGVESRALASVLLPAAPPGVDAQKSTLPSPISAQRPGYSHHGFSRSALLHQKSFWNSRHEEWMEWRSCVEEDEARRQASAAKNARIGITIAEPCMNVGGPPPHIRNPPSGMERDLQDCPPGTYEQHVYAPIYPRVGDISALRDPYSVNVDRCLSKFPLWTIHKMLYMFDMHQRSTFLEPSRTGANERNIEGSSPSSTVSPDTSVSSGEEDEDDTLVADDETARKGEMPPDSSPRSSSPRSSSPFPWNGMPAWELSWYARWELLLGLVQRNQANRDVYDACTSLATSVEVRLPRYPGLQHRSSALWVPVGVATKKAEMKIIERWY
ncbi:hypothetical protein BU15DRAFT_46225 [Melanogaster broomeanus]|nr:hypothetical protein BU15DRAFT_46225 [Melanogaster broomeanus]